MYTQCSHCKAIFRVTMKELTAAQGLLRCGECDAIFDAMRALSTTLPEERRFVQNETDASAAPGFTNDSANNSRPTSNNPPSDYAASAQTLKEPSVSRGDWRSRYPKTSKSKWFLWASIIGLLLLLLVQILYAQRHWLATQPLTAGYAHQMCELLGCKITPQRDVRQIKLLSQNVYSHPNTKGVLTISLSMQNEASFDQPYPLIEISFLNSKNEIVALRRFPPEEYLKGFNGELMSTNKPADLILNISDPGSDAVRFQFRFI